MGIAGDGDRGSIEGILLRGHSVLIISVIKKTFEEKFGIRDKTGF